MSDNEFELTTDHVKLLRRMYVGWNDAETGAPEIDPKRPYGNSDVPGDVAGILGWEYDADDDMPTHMEELAEALHRDTQLALQVVLTAGSFEPGLYRRTWPRNDWHPVSPDQAKEARLVEKKRALDAANTTARIEAERAVAARSTVAELEREIAELES